MKRSLRFAKFGAAIVIAAGLFAMPRCTKLMADPPSRNAGPLSIDQQKSLRDRVALKARLSKIMRQVMRQVEPNKELLEEAEKLASLIVDIDKKVPGDEDVRLAQSLTEWALVLQMRERFSTAASKHEEALKVLVAFFDVREPEHWRVVDAQYAVKLARRVSNFDDSKMRGFREQDKLGVEIEIARAEEKNADGVKLALKRRDMIETLLGADDRQWANATRTLAIMLQLSKDYENAEKHFRIARTRQRQLLGANHPHYQTTCTDLALLLRERGRLKVEDNDFAGALRAQQEEVDIFVEIFGDNDHVVKDGKRLVALTKLKSDWSPEQRTQYRELDKKYRSIQQLFREHRYLEAAPIVEKLAEETKLLLPASHYDHCLVRSLIAHIAHVQGDLSVAKREFEELIATHSSLLGDHPNTAVAHMNLAEVELDLGNLNVSLRLFRDAERIWKQIRDKPPEQYLQFLTNFAALLKRLGDVREATELFQEAERVFSTTESKYVELYITVRINRAALLEDRGLYHDADELLREVELECEADLPRLQFSYWTVLHNRAALQVNLGKVADNAGEFDAAQRAYQLGEALARKVLKLGEGVRNNARQSTLNSLETLAILLQFQGNHREAGQIFANLEQTYGQRIPAQTLMNIAAFHQGRGAVAAALPYARAGIDMTQRALVVHAGGLSERQRLSLRYRFRDHLNGYLSVALDNNVSEEETYRHVLLWKGAVNAWQAEERILRNHPAAIDFDWVALRNARFRYAHHANNPPVPSQQATWNAELNRLRKEKESREAALSQLSRDASIAAYLERNVAYRNVSPNEIANCLPKGVVLVDFFEYVHFSPPKNRGRHQQERRLIAFVSKSGERVRCIHFGSSISITELVTDWRRALRDRYEAKVKDETRIELAERELKEIPRQLANRIWSQKLKDLVDGSTTIIVSPDGSLCHFPFAVLPGAAPSTYLLDDFAIGYVASGRHALEIFSRKNGPAGKGYLGIGGIDYGTSLPGADTRAQLRPLEESQVEIAENAVKYKQRFPEQGEPTLLTGKDVDKPRVIKVLEGGPDHVQWAGHGFYNRPLRATLDRDPYLCNMLPLAGANQVGVWYNSSQAPEAALTAEDVRAMNLWRTRCVVLSACESGLGDILPNEGVLGLQRAFHQAGVATVVASYWQVHGDVTRNLMDQFCKRLWADKTQLGVLRAMREAQLEIKKSKFGGTEHPYYWASFSVSGAFGDLEPPLSNKAKSSSDNRPKTQSNSDNRPKTKSHDLMNRSTPTATEHAASNPNHSGEWPDWLGYLFVAVAVLFAVAAIVVRMRR